jgi:hypothetical protein
VLPASIELVKLQFHGRLLRGVAIQYGVGGN